MIFFKAHFISKICQNFNWEPLLDSMIFFLVPFFFSSVWSHEPWCQLCKLTMFRHVSYYLSRDRWNLYYPWVQMLLQMDLYYTWVRLLHLCLPQVPLTTNPDPWCEFGLRRNQTFSLLWWHFQGSHISPYFLPYLRPRYVLFKPLCK